ncbi:MAG: dihydrodipicolinate synthase family protein [Blautia sp.]|nr:dihydrodipicolinate synthase family protein [Blautia sp.]
MNASYITPAITIFDQNGNLDLKSQASLYENLIRNGIDGILVNGSIGEFFAMTFEQRQELARFAIKTIAHRTKCIIGTSDMISDHIVPFSREVLTLGADAVMIIGPYYFPMKDDQLFTYFDSLLTQIDGPVYLYNFPDRTGYTIAPETVLALRQKHDNLKGIKDTISGMDHTRELIKVVKSVYPDFEVYSGFDDNAAHNVLSGGNGIIGGLSNIVPEICTAWIRAMREDDTAGIARGQQTINRLFDIYSVGPLFVPIIKEAAKIRGIIADSCCTFPMPPATPEQCERIREILGREINL